MLCSAAAGPFMGVITVATWLKTLSPAEVAEYYFTSYDSLLSHMAMKVLLDEDFPRTVTQADTPTVANLKTAVAELYPGSTLQISNHQNKLRLAITVPGGNEGTWPEHIAKPKTEGA